MRWWRWDRPDVRGALFPAQACSGEVPGLRSLPPAESTWYVVPRRCRHPAQHECREPEQRPAPVCPRHSLWYGVPDLSVRSERSCPHDAGKGPCSALSHFERAEFHSGPGPGADASSLDSWAAAGGWNRMIFSARIARMIPIGISAPISIVRRAPPTASPSLVSPHQRRPKPSPSLFLSTEERRSPESCSSLRSSEEPHAGFTTVVLGCLT